MKKILLILGLVAVVAGVAVVLRSKSGGGDAPEIDV